MDFLKIGIKVPIGQERDFGQERVKYLKDLRKMSIFWIIVGE